MFKVKLHSLLHVTCCFLLMTGPAFGSTDIKQNLDQAVSSLEETQVKEQQLDEELGELREELQAIQKETVNLAKKIRKNEASIDEKSKSLVILEEQSDARQMEKDAMRTQLAHLLHAMVHMQRVPRQFVIAQPSNMSELLRTAGVLNAAYKGTDQRIEELRLQIEQIDELKQKVVKARTELQEEQIRLGKQHASLEHKIDEKRRIQRQLSHNHQALIARVKSLSHKTESLQELLQELEKEMAAFRKIGAPRLKPKAPKRKSAQFAAAKGSLRLPAHGAVIHRYGEKKNRNDTYKGQVIHTASRATVTVPFDGEVVFTGPFRDYGNMIIIQHDKQYHTLLAGLNDIQADPGQKVIQGEPVGRMGSTEKSRKLYLEVRKNSKAIDPAAWIGNVKGNKVARR